VDSLDSGRENRAMRLAGLLALVASLLAARTQADPSVLAFTPDHGPPGTLVKIIGSGLSTLVGVEFGGVEADAFRIVADNHVKATVPTQAMTGPIRLRTASGVAASAKSFVVEGTELDLAPRLAPPWPSPTRGAVTLRFTLPRTARARLLIHDLQGRQVVSLVDEPLPAGSYERRWDGRTAEGRLAPPGLYGALLVVQDQRVSRRFPVLR
jgi:hypothetical protein